MFALLFRPDLFAYGLFVLKLNINLVLVVVWFLFGEVCSSSVYLGWAALFYCGNPWPFYITILVHSTITLLLFVHTMLSQ